MAEISKSRFSIFKQTVAGNSGTNSNWQNLNVVLPGVSGGPANTVVESQRIDPDRNAPGVKLVGGASGLSIPFEAQVPTAATEAFWEMLRASVYADSADAALTSANNTSWTGNTLLINAGDDAAWDGGAVEIGDVLQVYSNAAPTVKYYARVTAITGDITDVQTDITSPTAAVDLRIKKGVTVTNGSTQATFGMLRSFYSPGAVAYDLFNLYTQEVMEAVQMSITSQSLVTGTFQTTGVGSASIAAHASRHLRGDRHQRRPVPWHRPTHRLLRRLRRVQQGHRGHGVVGLRGDGGQLAARADRVVPAYPLWESDAAGAG